MICSISHVEDASGSRMSSITVGAVVVVVFFLSLPFVRLDHSFTGILCWHKLALALEAACYAGARIFDDCSQLIKK